MIEQVIHKYHGPFPCILLLSKRKIGFYCAKHMPYVRYSAYVYRNVACNVGGLWSHTLT